MLIGVNSYLPTDGRVRQVRKNRIKEQYEFFNSIIPDTKIYCCAQQYDKDDYIDNVNYFKFNNGIGVSQSRNKLLEFFYNTDEDYMVMCDDDTTLYPYYDCFDLLKEMSINPNKFISLDVIGSVNPMMTGFKQEIYNNINTFIDNYVFVPIVFKSFAFSIVKNFKKYYNKEYYFIDIPGMSEDYELFIRLALDNISLKSCSTFIMKTPNEESVSTLFDSREQRRQSLVKTKEYLSTKFNLTRNKKGEIDWNSIGSLRDRSYKIIPRVNKMIVQDYMKPVPRHKESIRGLF